MQHFTVGLWWGQLDAEHPGRADHGAAQLGTIGSHDAHGAAGFGAAGDHAAVGTDGQFGRCRGCRDIGRGDLGGHGGHALGIEGQYVQQFAVGLGRGELDAEAAVGVGYGAANQRAAGIAYFHSAAGRGATREGSAIGIDGQPAGAGRGSGERYIVLDGHRSIAAGVHLQQGQLVAGLHGRVEVDQEGAVGRDHATTQQVAVGIPHFHRSPGFTMATEAGTARTDQDIADGIRRSNVRGVELQGRRAVAGGVDQAYVKRFTVGLGRGQAQAERSVLVDHRRAEQVTGSVAHLYGGPRFAAAGEGHPVRQCQVGGLCRWQQVGRRHCAWLRHVAGSVGEGDLQGAAILDGRVQANDEGAIRADGAGRDDRACGITHLHGAAGFATAAELAAGQADGQVAGCLRWGGVAAVDARRGHRTGGRGVASCVGGRGLQCLAIHLRRAEGNAEYARGADHCGAQLAAVGGEDTYGAAGFGTASEYRTVLADHQCARCSRGGDIRGCEHQGCRAVAGGIYLAYVQGFTVGLCGGKREAESAVGVDHAAANQVTGSIAHLHGGTRLAATAEGNAIGKGQVTRLVRGRGVGRVDIWRVDAGRR